MVGVFDSLHPLPKKSPIDSFLVWQSPVFKELAHFPCCFMNGGNTEELAVVVADWLRRWAPSGPDRLFWFYLLSAHTLTHTGNKANLPKQTDLKWLLWWERHEPHGWKWSVTEHWLWSHLVGMRCKWSINAFEPQGLRLQNQLFRQLLRCWKDSGRSKRLTNIKKSIFSTRLIKVICLFPAPALWSYGRWRNFRFIGSQQPPVDTNVMFPQLFFNSKGNIML